MRSQRNKKGDENKIKKKKVQAIYNKSGTSYAIIKDFAFLQ